MVLSIVDVVGLALVILVVNIATVYLGIVLLKRRLGPLLGMGVGVQAEAHHSASDGGEMPVEPGGGGAPPGSWPSAEADVPAEQKTAAGADLDVVSHESGGRDGS